MEQENPFKQYYGKWLSQAQDYPTKALIVSAMALYEEQREQIDLHKGKLDGISWSPEGWED